MYQLNLQKLGAVTVLLILLFVLNTALAKIIDLAITSLNFGSHSTATATQFNVTATGRRPIQYSWNFGDGSAPTSFSTKTHSTSHHYKKAGRYIVKVTLKDALDREISRTFSQLIYSPLTTKKPSISASLIEHAALNEVWNVNPDNDSVTIINTISHTKLAEISVGKSPRSLAIAPDGNVWVVNKGSSTITVINAKNRDVSNVIKLPPASQPHGLVFDRSAGYVALEATGQIVMISAADGKQLKKKAVGSHPRHLSITSDNKQLLVSRFITPPLPKEHTQTPITTEEDRFYGGEIILLNTPNLELLSKVDLRYSNRMSSDISGPGVPNYLGPAAISPDGRFAWIPSKQDNILAGDFRRGESLTFDNTVRAISSKIDLSSSAEDFPSRIDHDNAGVASYTVFSPRGIYLFTALEGNRQVAVSDANAAKEMFRFDVGRAPQGLAVSADGKRLYVHNFMSRSVGVFDITDLTSGKNLAVSKITTIPTVDTEKLAQNVLIGKQYFYDSRDNRLAAHDYMSCAACHNEGGQDGRVWDLTQFGEGLRNTISLKKWRRVESGLLHWSGNFDEVQDFELQIRRFASGAGLMKNSDLVFSDRLKPLGAPKAGVSNDLDALAAYVNSLNTSSASPYSLADGSPTTEASAGKTVFEEKKCGTCHSGNLHNIGTIGRSSGTRLYKTLSGIYAPTLHGLWLTAPYLHNGSAKTIADAIDAHANVSVTPIEKKQLVNYLKQLGGSF